MAHQYTEDQLAFIKTHIKDMAWKELTSKFNEIYNTNLSHKALIATGKRYGIKSGRTGFFSNGHSPSNKGKKYPGQTNKTSFKKGHKQLNYKPVGSERVDRDGYVLVKVSDEGAWHERWKHKHKVLWEEANGPIPKGHVVIFADADKQNLTLENFILVTKSQLVRLNQNHLIKNDAELTKTGVIIADIYTKIGERKRSVGKSRN